MQEPLATPADPDVFGSAMVVAACTHSSPFSPLCIPSLQGTRKGVGKLYGVTRNPGPKRRHGGMGFSRSLSPQRLLRATLRPLPYQSSLVPSSILRTSFGLHEATMERFRSDGRRFPAYTYKESSLLWQRNEWRQQDSVERSLIMGIPPSVLDSVAPKSSAGQRECAKCSLVGNSFHVPSAMLAIILACQLLPHAASCPAPMYGGLECRLRGCIQGTPWQPGLLDTWPGVRTSESLVGVLERQFRGLIPCFCRIDIYWVDTQMRGRPPDDQGPCWALQRAKRETALAMETQKGAPKSRWACPPLLPPGPAVMTALAWLMRWPDLSLGCRFVEGFALLGHVEEPALFRELDDPCPPPSSLGLASVQGDPARAVVDQLCSTLKPHEHSQFLSEFTRDEILQGIRPQYWTCGLASETGSP